MIHYAVAGGLGPQVLCASVATGEIKMNLNYPMLRHCILAVLAMALAPAMAQQTIYLTRAPCSISGASVSLQCHWQNSDMSCTHNCSTFQGADSGTSCINTATQGIQKIQENTVSGDTTTTVTTSCYPSLSMDAQCQPTDNKCTQQVTTVVAPPPTCHCNQCTGVCIPVGCSCPLAIDLLNEGMHFTSLADGVSFDFNGDGKPLSMSWTDPRYHNAWLALDRNHNGTIDSAQELFTYVTEPQILSADGKRSGWLALAAWDQSQYGGNGDGVIDAKDAIYSQLLLWIDENHDGISQPEELHPLQQMGVTNIELNYKNNKSYKDSYGNTFQFESFVTVGTQSGSGEWENRKHQAWDVVLNASDAPLSSGPQPDVYCSLAPQHSPSWDLGLGNDGDVPLSAFTLWALVGK